MTKLKKKVIVNVLTLSRIVAAFLLPFIFDKMEFWSFIILLGLIVLTASCHVDGEFKQWVA